MTDPPPPRRRFPVRVFTAPDLSNAIPNLLGSRRHRGATIATPRSPEHAPPPPPSPPNAPRIRLKPFSSGRHLRLLRSKRDFRTDNSSTILSLPTELLLIIFSNCFVMKPPRDEKMPYISLSDSRLRRQETLTFKAVRSTCGRFRDVVTSNYTLAYYLGDTATLSLLSLRSVRRFQHFQLPPRVYSIYKLHISCLMAWHEVALFARAWTRRKARVRGEVILPHSDDCEPERAFITGLDILRQVNTFESLEEVQVHFNWQLDRKSTKAISHVVLDQVLDNDIPSEILSVLIPSLSHVHNLTKLELSEYIPASRPECETEQWHCLLSRLQAFSLKLRGDYKLTGSEVFTFAERFVEHWLLFLTSVRKLEFKFSARRSTDGILGNAFEMVAVDPERSASPPAASLSAMRRQPSILPPSTADVDPWDTERHFEPPRYAKLEYLEVNDMASWGRSTGGFMAFLFVHRAVLDCVRLGGIRDPDRKSMPAWARRAWPIVEGNNWSFNREYTTVLKKAVL